MGNKKIIDELLEYYNDYAIKEFLKPYLNIFNLHSPETKSNIGTTFTELFKKLHYLETHGFHPDFNGNYNLVLMIPPHLSAPEYEEIFGKPFEINNGNILANTVKFIPILVENITLPSKQVRISESKLITGSIPVPEEVSEENQLSITYRNDYHGYLYTFHKLWIEYIDEVGKGLIRPNDYYIENSCLDYVAAFYILSFNPQAELKKLIYIPFAIPTGINPNEVIKFGSNDINTISISYSIYTYDEFDYFELGARGVTLNNPQNHPFLKKLHTLLTYWVNESNDNYFSTVNNSLTDNNQYASNNKNNLQKSYSSSNYNKTGLANENTFLKKINNILDNYSISSNDISNQLSNHIAKLVNSSTYQCSVDDNNNNANMEIDSKLAKANNLSNINKQIDKNKNDDKGILNKLASALEELSSKMQDNKNYNIHNLSQSAVNTLLKAYHKMKDMYKKTTDEETKHKLAKALETTEKLVLHNVPSILDEKYGNHQVTKEDIQNLSNVIKQVSNS